MNLQIEPADFIRNGKAPVNGPAVITNDDIPQAKIKGQVQDRECDQDLHEPLVEYDGQNHHQNDQPKPQLGIEVLLAVKLGATANAALLESALGVQFPAAGRFPSLAATLTRDKPWLGHFINKNTVFALRTKGVNFHKTSKNMISPQRHRDSAKG